MNEEIKVGDVVKVASDIPTPHMTVESVRECGVFGSSDRKASCVWFGGDDAAHRDTFRCAILVKVQP